VAQSLQERFEILGLHSAPKIATLRRSMFSVLVVATLGACASPMRMAETVDEILAAPESFEGREVLVYGVVSEPTVSRDITACEHRFELRDDHASPEDQALPVSLRACGEVLGLRPDDLAGDLEPRVSVRATVHDGALVAEELHPECWSKYDASILYTRACYEMAGIRWEDAIASVEAARAEHPR
jgi:hypothetical protein